MNIETLLNKIRNMYDQFDHGPGVYNPDRVKYRTEFRDFLRNTNFMTVQEYQNYRSEYAGKKISQFVRYAPDIQSDGYYQVHFLGKIRNSNWEGYLPTSSYFFYQLRCTKNFSVGVASGASFEFSLIGVLVFILLIVLLFMIGVLIRLPIGIALTVIQFLVTLNGTTKVS